MQKAISVLAVGALLVMLFGSTASAGAGVLIGTDRDDEMVGTDAATGDIMAALGGRDTVDARGGKDLVFGGPGDDGGMDGPALYGDFPDHEADSSADGGDAVRGGPGSDALHGFGGDDLLAGGAGNDRIFAGEDRFEPRGPVVPSENPGEDTVRGGRATTSSSPPTGARTGSTAARAQGTRCTSTEGWTLSSTARSRTGASRYHDC